MSDQPKGLRAWIYRANMGGDTSNGGLSAHADRVTIVGAGLDGPVAELREATPDAPAVRLVFRRIGLTEVVHAEPVEQPPFRRVGWMFGGAFIHTSDSRFSRAAGIYGAVALHDRSEATR